MTFRFRNSGWLLVGVWALAACSAESSGDSAARAVGTGDGETPGAGAGKSDGDATAGPTLSPGAGTASEPTFASGTASEGSSSSGASAPSTFPPTSTSVPVDPNNNAAVAGTLTAGTWDDNRNFDFFRAYRRAMFGTQRVGLLPIGEEDHVAANQLFAQTAGPKAALDVSLVIDTTGSMGDEIKYLQKEFIALSNSIEAAYPNAEQRWSLVLYRDVNDSYVVRWFDFRTDTLEFQSKLDTAIADGGGDFPEAPEQALSRAATLDWRADDHTARLAFWVADAPYHDDQANGMSDAIHALQAAKVHVYPVASSGVDEFTELGMRSTAQLTGGRYLFLTNDSGVGGDHKEPTTPCYFVTKLDKAITRMVDIELSGSYREPDAADILRTGGNPRDGACTLESGDVVEPY
jgi:hypothetical protein